MECLYIKYRQGGVSTFFLLWWLDDTLFHNNTVTGVLAHKWQSLKHLWGIIDIAYRNLPAGLGIGLEEDTKTGYVFKGSNSRIFVSLKIESVGIHNLHISEWCLCKDEDIELTMGATGPDTNISGESTGNGVGNDGYLTYQQAKTGDNSYLARFLPWFLQDEYRVPLMGMDPRKLMGTLNSDERKLQELMKKDYGMTLLPEQVLYRRKAKTKSKSKFSVNYPEEEDDAFFTSGLHFFTIKKWMALYKEAQEYKRKTGYYKETDDYIMYEAPQHKDVYAAAADTADEGEDTSCLKIINVTKRREAFKFQARCGVNRFYRVCNEFCRLYNNALLCVEANNHGRAVILGLTDVVFYKNLWVRVVKNRKNYGDKEKVKIGWETNGQTRPALLTNFQEAIEGEEEADVDNFEPDILILDLDLIKECMSFIKIDDKYQAEEGKLDDNVFASAIAYHVSYSHLARHVGRTNRQQNRFLLGKKREHS